MREQDPKYRFQHEQVVNRVTGVPIPLQEPVMVLRAKDIMAEGAIRFYAASCRDSVHRAVAEQRADAFAQFRMDNPDLVREPDSDPSVLESGTGQET